MGHFFLNSTHSLGVYTVTFLVDVLVCGQGSIPCFLQGPKSVHQYLSSSPCVRHLGELLEDRGAGHKAASPLCLVLCQVWWGAEESQRPAARLPLPFRDWLSYHFLCQSLQDANAPLASTSGSGRLWKLLHPSNMGARQEGPHAWLPELPLVYLG